MGTQEKKSSIATKEIEDLVRKQKSDLQQIRRVWINFQKSKLNLRTEAAIQSKLSQLQSYATTCQERNYEIERLADEEELKAFEYLDEEVYSEITAAISEVQDQLYEALQNIQSRTATVNVQMPASGLKSDRQTFEVPHISLPKFDGERSNWNEFRDLYQSLVHDRNYLSATQKLHYLKTSLVGEAALLLRDTPLIEAEYEPAWKSLLDMFDGNRTNVYKLIREFRETPPIGKNRARDLFHLHNRICATCKGASRLGRPLEPGFDVFMTIAIDKFDKATREAWESKLDDGNFFPDYEFLVKFLAVQIRKAEDIPVSDTNVTMTRSSSNVKTNTRVVRSHQTNVAPACFLCKQNHPLFQCPELRRLSVNERIEILRRNRRCLNCLRIGHLTKACTSKNSCKTCGRRHHTLVHRPNEQDPSTPDPQPTSTTSPPTDGSNLYEGENGSRVLLHHTFCVRAAETFLPTATVAVRGPSGACLSVRAILDQAAQGSFLSEAAAQFLRLERVRVDARVGSTGTSRASRTKEATTVAVEPLDRGSPPVHINVFILQTVLQYSLASPAVPCTVGRRLELADKSESTDTPVQLIIGGDVVGAFLFPEFERVPNSLAFFQRTVFGWVLTGNPREGKETHVKHPLVLSHVTDITPILNELTRFWALEEVPKYSCVSACDQACEKHFVSTHKRLPSGRYQVRLPVKTAPMEPPAGARDAALRLYLSQEDRLRKRPQVTQAYQEFLQDYLARGHMERVAADAAQQRRHWYLPHHAVLKRDGSLNSIGVVFNASFRLPGHPSLNDILRVGPKLQADLFALVMRWRQARCVMSTDIMQMFRQIQVAEEDQDLQCILWRPEATEEVHTYRLTTVTYGTACAPYLANRVLHQLAADERKNYPEAAEILTSQVYVDDILLGADDPGELLVRSLQLRQALMAGGFQTHKWATNCPELLRHFPSRELNATPHKEFAEEDSIQVLGISWNPKVDVFLFKIQSLPPAQTKRKFLSLLARLFDPLGWVAPVTVVGKILMQRLWQNKVAWDDLLPTELLWACNKFQGQLPELNQLSIPRWTGCTVQNGTSLQFHGFADASSQAYAAVIYVRVCNDAGVRSSLVYAKTKVASLKPISIPRLELCAATLLAKATKYVMDTLDISCAPMYLWTDSTVVLAWLAASPLRWKPFVANRVGMIQELLPDANWRHVLTAENPADAASRGISPASLLNSSLWWQGPPWLSATETGWTAHLSEPPSTDEEQRKAEPVAHATTAPTAELFTEFSSWARLIRVYSYLRRFVSGARKAGGIYPDWALSTIELNATQTLICHLVQRVFYVTKRVTCSEGTLIIKEKALRDLALFQDKLGLLRVGGRLRNASLSDTQKFPILLPHSHVATIIIRDAHECTLHEGLQATLFLVRRRYWILGARSLVKQCISNCAVCVRYRARMSTQLMGDLPAARVNPSPPFSNAGVDYAGPLLVRRAPGRGNKTHKAYIVIFICLATRAIHLECVSDYSSSSFLAAFRRFTARRGLPSDVYSDNGTTFVGANRELKQSYHSACRDTEFRNHCATLGVQWHFIPPASPHFGGLWEAGVKSAKHHLKRVLGAFTPTLDELNTLLCQIEAILNSRPLCRLHDDIESFDVLTPGHFLIGRPLNEAPGPSFLETADNRLTRWLTVEKQKQRFWRLWASDYLNSLQQRTKWRTARDNLKINDLVLVQQPNSPPACWEIGRVASIFPGIDQRVRVVEVRTAKGNYKRPVTQLCKLPSES